ncbi:ribosomal large subunit pseudouridine synthase F [Adhaeribacter arboris]|uniref:Pseudouridine synthase n=1 Tax=Adhaeribacter arboris TaxID=2072846 RepID=A0A2T2YD99_9BACT|nr:pseudouridine synthase [Adhaeribacter arboris]PSR53489.1 ribosomal large subunit pseudouridine synthase F [Adhaeribacter arboris]
MKILTASLKHLIVQKLRISNKQAIAYITSGRVQVNGEKGQVQQALQPADKVTFGAQVLKEPQAFIYLAYYKPRGIESTLNTNIQNNLAAALHVEHPVFPVGRLDKDSEGLMLLTNNGNIYDKIIHAKSHQEKEYLVTVNKPLTPEALAQLSEGVIIMGQKTRPAQVQQISATTFRIILTQGLNRQIRRMCYKLGYQVQQLVRLRMVNLELGLLKPGEWRYLSSQEIQELNQIIFN